MRLYDFYVRFSDARRFAECLSFVRAFPRQINIRASEMTERRGLTINRAAQIEHLDNARRTEIKQLVNNLSELFIRNNARTLRINQKGDWTRHADGIRQLNFTTLGKSGSYDVLGDIARGICGTAIHLGRILAAECRRRHGGHIRHKYRR